MTTFICRDCQIEQPLANHWQQDDCDDCDGEGCSHCDDGVTRSCEDCSRPTRVVTDHDETGPYEREESM